MKAGRSALDNGRVDDLELFVRMVDGIQQFLKLWRLLNRPQAVEGRTEQGDLVLGQQAHCNDPFFGHLPQQTHVSR